MDADRPVNYVQEPRLRDRWAGPLAIIDQCLFTGANFFTAVMVGRFGGKAELGKYSLAISAVMLTIAFQRSLLILPYVVVRGGLDDDQQNSLRRAMLMLCGAMSAAAISIALLGGLLLDDLLVGLVGLAISAACIRDFCRRIALTHLRLGESIWIDGVVAGSQVAGLAIIALLFSEVSAIAALAMSTVLWAAVGGAALIARCGEYAAGCGGSFRANIGLLWPTARWVSLSQLISTAQAYILPWVMAVAYSIELAGVYAACWTLVQAVSPVIEGLGNVLAPALARSAALQRWAEMRERVLAATGIFTAATGLLLLIAAVAGSSLLTAIYGTGYSGYYSLLLILTAATMVNSAGIPASKALTQLGYASSTFAISVVSLAVILITAAVCLRLYGENGAAWGLVIGSSVATAAKWVIYRRVFRVATATPCCSLPSQPTLEPQGAST